MLSELESYYVDWSNLEKAHEQNYQFLTALAADKEAMRTLIDRVPSDPVLWDMCEHNRQLDKLVLHDAQDRGFRIRIHLWSETETGHPHNHRWSFTTMLLAGSYEHIMFDAPGGFAAPDPSGTGAGGTRDDHHVEVVERFRTVEHTGDSYTMHHDLIHSTITVPHTISMMVRSPIMKAVSLTTDPETGRFWFGVGRQKQAQDMIDKRRLSMEQFEFFRSEVTALGIL